MLRLSVLALTFLLSLFDETTKLNISVKLVRFSFNVFLSLSDETRQLFLRVGNRPTFQPPNSNFRNLNFRYSVFQNSIFQNSIFRNSIFSRFWSWNGVEVRVPVAWKWNLKWLFVKDWNNERINIRKRFTKDFANSNSKWNKAKGRQGKRCLS